ncbi:hypothetical protein SDC9_153882 [bioreactor metagenome]|uniref:Uncharacterized protein n=1 Tax=bioreactor metagenome TaxID=1076179 RepID=A0A645EYW4_9ZZZZ
MCAISEFHKGAFAVNLFHVAMKTTVIDVGSIQKIADALNGVFEVTENNSRLVANITQGIHKRFEFIFRWREYGFYGELSDGFVQIINVFWLFQLHKIRNSKGLGGRSKHLSFYIWQCSDYRCHFGFEANFERFVEFIEYECFYKFGRKPFFP